MRFFLSTEEASVFSSWRESFAANAEILRLLAAYLNQCPRLVDPMLVAELTASCNIGEKEAFLAILAAALDLDEERSEREARLVRDYLPRAVFPVTPSLYASDPYMQNVSVPCKLKNGWSLCREEYTPYEAFVCGGYSRFGEYCEVPSIGYFPNAFSFPAVKQNGVEWMAVKPNEIETMRAPLAAAQGDVLTYGLGLGYYAYMASARAEVRSVTVVERDASVISLFREELLPQFPCRDKITVIEADALEFAEREQVAGRYDTVFADLWHDTGDGLPLYLRLRRAEKEESDTRYTYWIEDQLLSALRAMVFSELERVFEEGTDAQDGRSIRGLDAVREMLSDRGLRDLAKHLRRA